MQPTRVQSIRLARHPDTPESSVHYIEARVCRRAEGSMQITYAMHGPLDRLRIPPPALPARTDGLWRHTCFELFIKCAGEPAYYELNFSPSGAWAAYFFAGYRAGAAPFEQALNPHLAISCSANKLTLEAAVPLALLFPQHASVTIGLAISAVVEELDGRLSYWALRHAPGKPDFHHSHAYALELDGYGAAVSAS